MRQTADLHPNTESPRQGFAENVESLIRLPE